LVKIKVTLEDQPRDFILRQPPETKRALRAALHGVEAGTVFPEPLEDELEGFYKLKVGDFRIVLQAVSAPGGPRFRAVFAERRKSVYVLFSQLLGLE